MGGGADGQPERGAVMKLTDELLEQALANPMAADADVRRAAGIPANRYYEMSVWPTPGIIHVSDRVREKSVAKISKSNQP